MASGLPDYRDPFPFEIPAGTLRVDAKPGEKWPKVKELPNGCFEITYAFRYEPNITAANTGEPVPCQ